MNTIPLEEDTRALINTSLVNLGWKWSGTGQNIYFERTKTKEEQKKLNGKRPDYVLYPENSNNPLIVIEAKRKGARIDSALEQGIDYAKAIGAPLVFATDGVFCKSYHTIDNCTPILNGEELDEFVREALAIKFLNNHEVNTVSTKVQYDRKELIKIFDETNNLLRGEGLRAGIDRFGEFANILFLKLISETEQIKIESGEKTRFDSYCHWNAIKEIPLKARIEYINNTVYKRLNTLYNTEIFTPLNIRNENILSEIMDKLDPLVLTDVDSDVKGDAFEYFLRASTATKNDLGEYFTPRHIVKTMVRLINPQIGEKIYDPFCGTGGFLIESFRYIYNNMARTEQNIDTLKNKTVYGNEITNTARITKMNMILAGDGHSNIKMQDSLANPVDGSKERNGFDAVITNMPYSQKTQYGTLYDIPSKNGDSVCVQHCMKAINNMAHNGRMALVVPEGFLFRKDLAKTREYLLERCQLQSIISLPQGVFLPYTGVKTDIIYATNVNQKIKSSERKKDFWYFDVKNDGYTLDNHRRKLDTPSDLSKYEEYRRLDSEQANEMLKVGFETISLDRVHKNSFILAGNRYRNTFEQIKGGTAEFYALKDICDIIAGQSPKGEYYNKNGVGTPFYQGNIDFGNTYINKPSLWTSKVTKDAYDKDILISVRAPVGEVNVCNNHICIGRGLAAIRASNKIDYKYLFYLMKYYGGQLLKNQSMGSTFESVTKKDIEDLYIPVPNIEKQKEIVVELDKYQKIILGARDIAENYSIEISCSFSELKPLCEISSFNPKKSEVKGIDEDTEVSFVPMADINTFDINFECQSVRKIRDVISGYTYFKNNDILLAKITPCFENGKAGIARNLKNGIGFGSTEYIVIRANTDIVYPEWIFYHINYKGFLQEGKKHMTGTAGQQRVSLDFVKQYQIPVPPLEEQKKILDKINYERSLIEPSKKIIEIFENKIRERVKGIWEE